MASTKKSGSAIKSKNAVTKTEREDEILYLRIPPEMAKRLDVLAEQLQRRTGLNVSRNDFVRKLLRDATDSVT